MRISICSIGILIMTGCAMTPPASIIEPGSSVSGNLIASQGCYWLKGQDLPRREVAAAAGARFVGTGDRMKFIGTDKSVIAFGIDGKFIAGEGPQRGKCSDENVLLIYRIVRP